MGSPPALIQEHDKITIARQIAKHTAPVVGPVASAIGDIALKKIADTKPKEVVGVKRQNFKFSSHLRGRFVPRS